MYVPRSPQPPPQNTTLLYRDAFTIDSKIFTLKVFRGRERSAQLSFGHGVMLFAVDQRHCTLKVTLSHQTQLLYNRKLML